MSYETTKAAIAVVNAELESRFVEGKPYRVHLNGKPAFRIIQFKPFSYEQFGTFANRAPHVVGSLALRSIVTAPGGAGGAELYYGAAAEYDAYGFRIDTYNEQHMASLQRVTSDVGVPMNIWPV